MNYTRMRQISFRVIDVTYQTNSFNGQTPFVLEVASLEDDGWKEIFTGDYSGQESIIAVIKDFLIEQMQEHRVNLTDSEIAEYISR